jgi:hypothetical protein
MDRKIRDGNRVLADHILANGQLEPPPEAAEDARHAELIKAGYNGEGSLRHSALYDQLRKRLVDDPESLELLGLLSAAHCDEMLEVERLTLDSLVIGIHNPGNWPGFSDWRTTRRTTIEPDECDHRNNAEAARMFRSMGAGDEVAEKFERLARASLERDLGDDGPLHQIFAESDSTEVAQ